MRSQEEVQGLLGAIHAPLAQIVMGAWEDWGKVASVIGRRFARTPANVVYERMIARAIPAFESMPGMRVIAGHQTVHFVYKESVRFRFKKGDDQGLSRSYPTQMALAFHDQTSDLFGAQSVSRVDIVYQVDHLATRIVDVCVVARHDENILWSYSITAMESKSADIVELTPRTPSPVESLVRPKLQRLEEEQSGSESL